nr:kinesin-like protein KIN-1 [Tanacetum cinerariifolium]
MSEKNQETSLSLNDMQLKVVDMHQRILKKLKEKLDAETLNLIEEEFLVAGLLSDPSLSEEVKSNHEGVFMASETISAWKAATNKLVMKIVEQKKDNWTLKDECEVMRVKYDAMKNANSE